MKVLVINCGSSSLKYQVLDMTNEALLCKGLVERIGMEGSVITHEKIGMDKVKNVVPMNDHKDAIAQVLDAVQNAEHGVVKSMDEIGAVGHRVVHAGEKFACSVKITEEVVKALGHNMITDKAVAATCTKDGLTEFGFEMIKEMNMKPVSIKTLNIRVDTARDLVLKLYNTSNEIIRTAALVEVAIVYGNRYRPVHKNLDHELTRAEDLFYEGEYKKALDNTIRAINVIEPGIQKKLLESARR